jgi:hypothetical protein
VRGGSGIYNGCIEGADWGYGGGGVIAVVGGLWAAAGRLVPGIGNGGVVTVSGEPHQCQPCWGDDIFGARHSSGNLAGERSSRNSHTHIALWLWAAMLLVLVGLILLFQKGSI